MILRPALSIWMGWIMLAMLLAVDVPAGLAATQPSAPSADKTLPALQETAQEVTQANARAEQAIASIRAKLEDQERSLKSGEITLGNLEQARLDVDAANAELANVRARLAARRVQARRLQDQVAQQQSQRADPVAGGGDPAGLDPLDQARARDRRGQQALQRLIAALNSLQGSRELQSALTQQRLDLLQRRFDLTSLEQTAGVAAPRREQLQNDIKDHLDEASGLRERSAGITDDSAGAIARKRLLNVQAQVAEVRAKRTQQELQLLKDSGQVRNLAALAAISSIPVATLKAGREMLTTLGADLRAQHAALQDELAAVNNQQRIVRRRQAVVRGEDSTLEQQQHVLQSLQDELTKQGQYIQSLVKTATEARQRYDEAIGQGARAALVARSRLPQEATGWERLGHGLTRLPYQGVERATQAVATAGNHLRAASIRDLLLWGAAELLFMAALLWLRQGPLQRLLERRPDSATAVPVKALRRNLLGLIPPGFVVIAGWLLDLPRVDLQLLLTILLIWPAVKFLLNLFHLSLVDGAPSRYLAFRKRLYAQVRWVMILGSLLVALFVLAQIVATKPVVVDALSRLSMLLLLLVTLPSLKLRAVILSVSSREQPGFWLRLGATLCAVVPLVLVTSALIGLAGYINLAWTITLYLGWLSLVAMGWLLARALFRDGVWYLNRWLASKGEEAQFWRHYTIAPLYRLGDLALLALAGFILFSIYDWNAQTPVIRWVPVLLNTTLFSLGGTAIRASDLALAGVLVFLVFWIGSWSKQFSYRYAYIRISDQGVRQSLATFTQYVIVVFGLMIAFKTIGVDLTALTVFAGALGVGIGFGLQTITSNFISGVLLLAERPLRANDIVNVDKYEGEVTHIGLRALTVKTWDQQDVIIPNSSVISQPFTNWTRGDDVKRSVLLVRISYDSDPHRAVEVIKQIVHDHPAVLAEPAFKVILWEFAESAIVIRIQYYTNVLGSIGLMDAQSQILFTIWDRFAEAGIKIPYPQQDVYVRSLPAGDSPARPSLGMQQSR